MAVAVGHGRDLADPPRDQRREPPRQHPGGAHPHHQRQRRQSPDCAELLLQFREREREADDPHRGGAGRNGNGDVHHVGVDRGAVARGHAHAGSLRLQHFGTRRVVVDLGQLVEPSPRVAEHASVRANQRDPHVDARAEILGLGIERGRRPLRLTRDELRHEDRFRDERPLDSRHHLPAHRPRDERRRGRHGDQRRRKGRQKQLAAKRHAPSLYPNCLTVTIASCSSGIFSRRRRTCTSTVRVPPVYW
jgi:hypothetical protein